MFYQEISQVASFFRINFQRKIVAVSVVISAYNAVNFGRNIADHFFKSVGNLQLAVHNDSSAMAFANQYRFHYSGSSASRNGTKIMAAMIERWRMLFLRKHPGRGFRVHLYKRTVILPKKNQNNRDHNKNR
ncbi:Uncharacterised protein [Chryseobacterium taklimakanense]|uniref:Uncharacterized protein n=1 Tax=Chryseobacterium taklimakanense TaxID=536441 RepID=A0A239WKN2_9FLAO|nr:Uncharacterised protein [Chryseobacterium taklimakanense]